MSRAGIAIKPHTPRTKSKQVVVTIAGLPVDGNAAEDVRSGIVHVLQRNGYTLRGSQKTTITAQQFEFENE